MTLNRKEFIRIASVAFAGLAGDSSGFGKLRVCKSTRFEGIQLKGTVEEKFSLAKQAGFNAVEVNSQGYNRKEMLFASEKTGLKIASVYHGDNWLQSISSIDEKARVQAVKSVLNSISVAEYYDAEFIQLLPGIVDESKPEESHKSLFKSLQEISSRIGNGKLKALVQNFPSLLFNDPEYFLNLFESLKSKSLGFCLSLDCLSTDIHLSEWSELLLLYPSKIDVASQRICSTKHLTDSFCKVDYVNLDMTRV